ncbi:hypothetical protein O6H91_01G174200 [Diphasiastrum complanatum]|uniref:Uncharacterized protein n=1 Tax=Diphasiastrum complanatum TaxID=34168 RepID=A0ACC2EYV0_DIPCM|nr:hypothetical protein O6H91_01G174200 [Diphasiastrum complanatum]
MEKIVLLCMVISACCMALSMAATTAPPPKVDCNSQLPMLLPCLDYVQGKVQTPSSECCTGLSSMVKTSPSCLCSLLSSGVGSSINTTRALEIPSKCKIRGVSASQCAGGSPPLSSGPAPAPVAGGAAPGTSEGGSAPPSPNSGLMSTPAISSYLGLIAVCLLF